MAPLGDRRRAVIVLVGALVGRWWVLLVPVAGAIVYGIALLDRRRPGRLGADRLRVRDRVRRGRDRVPARGRRGAAKAADVRRRALAAGLAGSVVSAFPSTLWTLIRRGDVLEGGRALGLVLLPNERRTVVLLVAGAPVHLALSVGWAYVLAAVLPPRAEPLYGAAGGAGDRGARPGGPRPAVPADPRASAGPPVGRSRGVRAHGRSRASSHSASGPSASSRWRSSMTGPSASATPT